MDFNTNAKTLESINRVRCRFLDRKFYALNTVGWECEGGSSLVLDGGGVCVVEEGGGLDRGETDKKSAAANL